MCSYGSNVLGAVGAVGARAVLDREMGAIVSRKAVWAGLGTHIVVITDMASFPEVHMERLGWTGGP